MHTYKSRFMLLLNKYIIIVIFLIVMAVFGSLSVKFLSMQNLGSVMLTQAIAACLSLGAMFILVSGEFDLSLGYNLNFCAVLCAFLAARGWGAVPVFLASVLMGTFAGLLNGLVVVKLKISSFIVTLSIGLMLSGLSRAVTGGGILSVSEPKALMNFARGSIGPWGYCVIFFLVLALIVHLVFSHTPFGRHMYAVGISTKASFMAGIKVDRIRILAFMCAGMFAGISGAILLGQLGAASSAYGTSLLLPAYAVVFLSKTAIRPGYINIPGLLIATLLISFSKNGVQMIGVPNWGNHIFEGAVLIFAMWLSTRFSVSGRLRSKKTQGKPRTGKGDGGVSNGVGSN